MWYGLPLARAAAASNSVAVHGGSAATGAARPHGAFTGRSPSRRTRLRCRPRRSSARSGPVFVEDRVGVVDVDEHAARTLRAAATSCSIMPPGPLCGRWPMSRARFFDRPSADHLVVGPEGAVDQHAVGSLQHRARHAAGISPQARRVEQLAAAARGRGTSGRCCRPARTLAVRRVGRRLASTGNARHPRCRAMPGSRTARRRAHAMPAARRSSARSTCRIGMPVLRSSRTASVHPQRRAARRARAASAGRSHGRSARPPARRRRSPVSRSARCGCSAGFGAICWRMSGEALNSTQRSPSADTAIDDCVRGARAACRRRRPRQLPTVAVPLRKAAAGR